MTRIIECQVTDEYVRGSGVVVGAAGSHNDVALRLAFNPMWAGTARSIVWKDALGGNPIITVLGTDLLVPGETEVYIVPIPAEPKAYAGDMSMTIKGAVVDGDKESAATLTARAFFTVMESDWDENAEEAQDITPTQAAQFQAQLEAIKDDISKAAKAVEETTAIKEAAGQHAADAAESAQAAGNSASAAENSASLASLSAQGAANSANNANDSRLAAAASEQNVENAKSAAQSAAAQAEASRQAAAQSQGAAATSEQSAAQHAEAARQSATSAADAEAQARACKADAEASRDTAAASEKAAKEAQKAAENARDEAQGIAGGDFASVPYVDNKTAQAETNANTYTDQKIAAIPTPDVSGQIDLHNTAQDAHSDIRSAVSNAQKAADNHIENKSNPHGVTAEQVGARPAEWMPTAADVGAMKQLSATAELSLMGWYKIGYFPSTIYPAQAIVMLGNAYTDSEPHMVTAAVSFAGQYSPNIVVLASNQSGNNRNFTKLRIVKDATANGYALETYYAKDALNMAYVTIFGNVDDAREWTVHAFETSVAKEAAKIEVTVDKVQSGNALTDASGVKKSGDTMTGVLVAKNFEVTDSGGGQVLHTGNKDQIFTYGTDDIEAGSASPYATGHLHFVYE